MRQLHPPHQDEQLRVCRTVAMTPEAPTRRPSGCRGATDAVGVCSDAGCVDRGQLTAVGSPLLRPPVQRH